MAADKEKELSELRGKIDSLDSEIIARMNERLEIAVRIGKLKSDGKLPVFHPEREKQVLEHILDLNRDRVLPDSALISIYTELMSASRALQRPLKIAYLGPKATYTHMALQKHFGSSVEAIPVESISDTFNAVESGAAEYGVVPVENSTEGVVTHTLDQFIDSNLIIVSEIYMNISHCLLSTCTDITKIKKVYSHPQSFAQCRRWLQNNLGDAEQNETSSNSKAASIVVWDKFSAAIASNVAASVYDLAILARNIEDNPENITRFLVIGKTLCRETGKDKTSLVCSVKDKPGALHDLLAAFSGRGINMTKIESRPTRRKAWEYNFYIDLSGHVDSPQIREALTELEETTQFIKVLGSYPVGRVLES